MCVCVCVRVYEARLHGQGQQELNEDKQTRVPSLVHSIEGQTGERKCVCVYTGAELKVSDLGDSNEVWLAGDEQQPFIGRAPNMNTLPVGSLNKQSSIW